MIFKTIRDAVAYVGGFSKPSKMPCPSYSLPAQECPIGKRLRNVAGSVCSKCYALKGNYVFPNVKKALYARFESLKKPLWVQAMAFAINEKHLTHFRWHDSGEIQSVGHLQKIVDIARLCPDCHFWLPTREMGIVAKWIDNGGILPDNLTVRISAAMINGKPPIAFVNKYGLCVSSVSADMANVNCHAYKTDGKCGKCRSCWNKNVFNVVYKQH